MADTESTHRPEIETALAALDGVLALRLEERDVMGVHGPDRSRRLRALAARNTPIAGPDPLPDRRAYLDGGALGRLAEVAGLDDAGCLVLTALMAQHVDERYAELVASLSDRSTSVITGEALRNLCGRTVQGRVRANAAMSPTSPLVTLGIIEVFHSDLGPLAGEVKIPDDVLAVLLGTPRPSPRFSHDFPASPLSTVHSLDDVVVPRQVRRRIDDILDRIVHRDLVLHEWGFGRHHDNVLGLTVLFHGPSGTGKTMTAAALAKAANLPALRIDLANLVSKYIGETAKNLERIFQYAERERALLFFDEADAVFGKRGEVTDSRDRYANQEISYLLQRIETYPGTVILATNLFSNIDDAFIRRIAIDVEFPAPGVRERRSLWSRVIPGETPRGEIDVDRLARTYEMTGAQIRDAVIEAAYRAASNGGVVSSDHIDEAIRLQFRKSGQMVPG